MRGKSLGSGIHYLFVLLVLLTGCVSPDPVSSLITSTVGPIMAGWQAKKIVNQVKDAGAALINQGGATANPLLTKTGNELTVAAQNAALALGDQMDILYRNLSAEHKMLLNTLVGLQKTTEGIAERSFDMIDTLSLDLRDVASRFPLVEDCDFFVKEISGIGQLASNRDFEMDFKGIGFGPDQDRRRSKIVSFSIQGKPVRYREEKTQAYITKVVIPNDELMMFFSRTNKVVLRDIVVVTEVERKTSFGWRQSQHPLQFTLTLIPLYAADLKITYDLPKLDWVTVKKAFDYTETTPDHHQERNIKHYTYTYSSKLPDNKRFINPYARAEGEGQLWSNISGKLPVAKRVKPYVSEDGHKVSVAVSLWGHAFKVVYGADIQEQQKVGVVTMSTNRSVNFGDLLTVDLPIEADDWRIEGLSVENKRLAVPRGQSFDLLQFVSESRVGNQWRVVYRIAPPAGIKL